MLSDTYFMKEAMKEAQKAFEKDEVPIGAVIVCNDVIIARAHNLVEALQDVTAHAEILAYTAAAEYLGNKLLPQCTMYVTLEPCPMCAGALSAARIGRLVFGAHDEKRGYSIFNNKLLHASTKLSTGFLKDESINILQKFFNSKRE
ncbi:MAG: nucleoside deaminase [Bacteroidales bacterium]|nr:nucleoside deaminase [Bacteroidales bacterium]